MAKRDTRFNMNRSGSALAPKSTWQPQPQTTIKRSGASGDTVAQTVIDKYKRINPPQRGR